MQLIRKHASSFQEFGELQFQMRDNRRGEATEYAMLNEHQARWRANFWFRRADIDQRRANIIPSFLAWASFCTLPQ